MAKKDENNLYTRQGFYGKPQLGVRTTLRDRATPTKAKDKPKPKSATPPKKKPEPADWVKSQQGFYSKPQIGEGRSRSTSSSPRETARPVTSSSRTTPAVHTPDWWKSTQGFYSRPEVKPSRNSLIPQHESIPGFTGTGRTAPQEQVATNNRRASNTQYGSDKSDEGFFSKALSAIGRLGGGSSLADIISGKSHPNGNRLAGNNAGVGNGVQNSSGRDRMAAPSTRPKNSPFAFLGQGAQGAAQQAPPIDNTQYTKTLADFLAEARSVLQSGQESALSGLAAQEGAYRGNAASAQQQIGSGYKALSSFIGGQAAPIQQAYQSGIDQTGAISQDAQSDIQAGNATAQAQQQAIMNRLGIGDANVAIANTGTTLEEVAAQGTADIAQRTAATQGQMASNQQSALNYNTAMGTSAQLEGQGEQNRVTRDLNSLLADVASQRSQINSSIESDAYGLAQQLMDQDYQTWQGNYDRKYQTESDAMQFAQEMAEQQARQAESQQQGSEPLNSTSFRALGPAGQANYAMQQSGVEPGQAAIITRAIEEAYAKGGIRNAADFARLVREAGGINPANQIDAANAAAIYYQYFA